MFYRSTPNVLKEKPLNHFLDSKNNSFFYELPHISENINYFISMLSTRTAISSKVVHLNDLKQLPRETEVEFFCLREQNCSSVRQRIFLKDKVSTFIFWLQIVVQTVVAHKIEELDDSRGLVKDVI